MTLLSHLSDLLLLAATGGMALYCRALSRRLRAFNDLDAGIGVSVAALSAQVDDLKASIREAHADVSGKDARLRDAVATADDRIGRLELLLAGLEDVEAEVESRLDAPPAEQAAAVPAFRAMRGDRSIAR